MNDIPVHFDREKVLAAHDRMLDEFERRPEIAGNAHVELQLRFARTVGRGFAGFLTDERNAETPADLMAAVVGWGFAQTVADLYANYPDATNIAQDVIDALAGFVENRQNGIAAFRLCVQVEGVRGGTA